MVEELNKAKIYIDDLYYFRVLDPKITKQINDSEEECKEYSNQFSEFQKLVEKFVTIVQKFSKDVDKGKIRAINTQNQLKTISKRREIEQQIYQSQILEQNVKLQRLKTQLQYLQLIESEQQEILSNLTQNQ